MRRWLPRSFWLLAWSVWAWLGWGLYRELPRDIGQAVSRLPLIPEGHNSLMGFLHGEKTAVTVGIGGDDEERRDVRLWDLGTGDVKREWSWEDRGFSSTTVLAAQGVCLALPSPTVFELGDGLHVSILNLRTGAWRHLSLPFESDDGSIDTAQLSPGGTHVMVHQFLRSSRAGMDRLVPTRPHEGRVVVLNILDGKTVLDWRAEELPRRYLATDPIFLGPANVGIPTTGDDKGGTALIGGDRLEVWDLDAPGGRKSAEVGITFGRGEVISANAGRLAISHHRPTRGRRPSLGKIDVVELANGETIFSCSIPKNDEQPSGLSGASLSADGTSLLLHEGVLFEIKTGRIIWRCSPSETLEHVDGAERFETRERWGWDWATWLPKRETFATRDVATARLVHRTWRSTARSFGEYPQQYLGDLDGTIYPMPPQVNYPLLALCQTILALPLVLLGLALRWRR